MAAGYPPKTTPMTAQNNTAAIPVDQSNATEPPMAKPYMATAPADAKRPKRPPTSERMQASQRNWAKIWRRLAPTALRMPISLVHSETATNMMFMMPMPPTSREMAAMPPKSRDMVLSTSSMASNTWDWLLTE